MTPQGLVLLEAFRAAFDALQEHAKVQPAEVAIIGQHVRTHLHSAVPSAFLLDTGPVALVEPENTKGVK